MRRKKPRHYAYLPTPILGVGGERSEPEGGGYIKWRPNISKGRHLHLPFFIHNLPFLSGPFHHSVVPLPPSSGGRQDFEKMESRHYAYLPTPILGVGGERSETEGGICHAAAWI